MRLGFQHINFGGHGHLVHCSVSLRYQLLMLSTLFHTLYLHYPNRQYISGLPRGCAWEMTDISAPQSQHQSLEHGSSPSILFSSFTLCFKGMRTSQQHHLPTGSKRGLFPHPCATGLSSIRVRIWNKVIFIVTNYQQT